MKTLLAILVIAASAFFYVSCNDADSILTSPGGNTAEVKPVTSFTGSADGETNAPNGMNHPLRRFEGTGTSSLTNGECTIVLEYWALPNGTTMLGTGKLIAKNGNELHVTNMAGTYTITGTTCIGICSGDIAGGTGQFINALGTITVTATIDVVTRVTHGEWTGTLSHAKPFSGTATGLNITVTEPPCMTGYTRRYCEGTGNFLHFGEITTSLGHCINLSTGLILGGNGNVKNLEGELINIDYTGCITRMALPNYDILIMGKIVSGTGKFSGASGAIIMYCVGNMVTGEIEAELHGAIDY